MSQFNLHDSLRIYLPGLLCCILLYILNVCVLDNISSVALPAIFVGILIDISSRNLHRKYFNWMIEHQNLSVRGIIQPYIKELESIINYKLNKNELSKIHEYEGISTKFMWYLIESVHARYYSSEKLLMFRSPKSYGVMCFNSALISFVFVLFLTSNGLLKYANVCEINLYGYRIGLLLTLGLSSFIFFMGSRFFFMLSLKMELIYLRTLDKDDMGLVSELIDLWIDSRKLH